MKKQKQLRSSLWISGIGVFLLVVGLWGRIGANADVLGDYINMVYGLSVVVVFSAVVMILIGAVLFALAVSASSGE
mgnify:CR=1 FL=1